MALALQISVRRVDICLGLFMVFLTRFVATIGFHIPVGSLCTKHFVIPSSKIWDIESVVKEMTIYKWHPLCNLAKICITIYNMQGDPGGKVIILRRLQYWSMPVVGKKVYMNICLILSGYGDRTVWIWSFWSLCTRVAKCIEVDGEIFETFLWTVTNLSLLCNEFVV